jgi:hypothetical protein
MMPEKAEGLCKVIESEFMPMGFLFDFGSASH